jgi:xanthine dehydrogenase large subunit
VADRAILHVDNAYFLEDVLITSYRCKTNLPSQTASRGSGAPQGMVLIERIMGDIALVLGLDPLQVRLRNVYDPEDRSVTHYQMRVADNILEPVLRRLSQTSHYQQRRADIAAWNAQSPVIQRGIALTPVKFGINFAATLSNQAGALVHVYADGSVQVSHGGVEMGQGIDTKIAQVVAQELGIPFAQVSVAPVDTSKVPNTSASAFSEIDLNGRAAQAAARHVRDNLAAFVASLDQCGLSAVQFAHGLISSPKMQRRFSDVVQAAYANRIHLWSDGFYRSPKIHYDQATHKGRPFYYFSYGAACSEVAVDTLTGESRVLRVDILHDVGRSINPALDIGQIEGGFVQGMGWLTTEQLVWDTQGRLQSAGPATYKIPTAGDVPLKFQIELWPEPNYEDSLHGSKAVGEPPMMLAISVFEALRDAVATACGTQTPVPMQVPATAQEVLRAQSVLRNLPYADQALREGDGAPLAALGT